MILAAPLVIPFAKAVGLSVGTLGMAALADQVNDYIQANPEESMKILSTIIPGAGIGQIFMSKEDKISLEDLDEMTDEEAQDLSKEEKAELMKQAGKSGGPNKRQTMIDISEKLGLSGEGKEKQDIEYDIDERYDEGGVEEVSKPKFDYKKFFRNRRADGGAIRKNFSNGGDSIYDQSEYALAAIKLASDKNIGIGDAMMITSDEDFDINSMEYKGSNKGILEILNQKADGGAIGIEVLFREKKNLGGLLTGQAKSIYDSMTAAGYFTEDEIRNAIIGAGYEIPGASQTETTAPNIIGAQLNQGGGGGMTGLQKTFTKDLSGDPRFNYLTPQEQSVKYRFDRSVEPRDGLMGFFDKVGNKFKESKFFQPKIRGTLGTRLANQPKLPIPSFASILSDYTSPFNIKSKSYNPLLEEQLNFAETQEGIIGRDPNSGLLKYGPESVLSGKNVISMFGTNDYEKMLVDYISKMNANKRISATTKAARLAQAQKELEELQAKTEAARAAQYGQTNYGRGSDGQRSYSGDALGDKDLGFGIGATTGGPVSNRTGRGRQDYYKGGLASMFVEKR